MSYDNVSHLTARIKPKQQKVSWFSLLVSEVSPVKHTELMFFLPASRLNWRWPRTPWVRTTAAVKASRSRSMWTARPRRTPTFTRREEHQHFWCLQPDFGVRSFNLFLLLTGKWWTSKRSPRSRRPLTRPATLRLCFTKVAFAASHSCGVEAVSMNVVMWWSVIDVLVAGELHLTPLQGILQMRPSFTYLDKADTKHREREAANEGVGCFGVTSGVFVQYPV